MKSVQEINTTSFPQLMSEIARMLTITPTLNPSQIYDRLVENGLFNPKECSINFGQAQALDKLVLNHLNGEGNMSDGGSRWLNAFGRPEDGSVFEFEGSKCYATNCGVFTFDLYFLDEDWGDSPDELFKISQEKQQELERLYCE